MFSKEICFSNCKQICKEKIRFLLEVQTTYLKFIQIFSGVYFGVLLEKDSITIAFLEIYYLSYCVKHLKFHFWVSNIWENRLIFIPRNTTRAFHVETTWKQPFLRCFKVEYTRCVCRDIYSNRFHANIPIYFNTFCNLAVITT